VTRPTFRTMIACGALLLTAGSGNAQLLPSLGGVPGQVVGGVLGSPGNMPVVAPVIDRLNDVGGMAVADTASLLDLRRARLQGLIHDHRRVLDSDRDGNPVRKGEVIAIDPLPDTIARARGAGFRVQRDEQIEDLQLHVVTFALPPGDDTREGLSQLRRIAPEGQFDYNHVFEPAGTALLGLGGSAAAASVPQSQAALGMIDGGVSAHPSLRNASIEQRGFAAQGARPSGHGTAIASLIVGSDGRFQGAARGVSLLVADVYGGDPTEGSAVAIARALGWLTARGVRVINVSLVGPTNPLLERAVAASRARGILIVAAVGNDGPAAPPSYPASYPGVVAVTGVDSRNRALPEAGKALHLDFAAPGAEMAAALPGSGYATVRGTSFAAPLVTARLIAAGGGASAIEALSREAVSGHGRVGRGIVCESCRVVPRTVGAKR
jgi:subtilisin family serine protease